MRILLFILLMSPLCKVTALEKDNATRGQWQRHQLFHGNVQVDVPAGLQVDSQYFHYWDKCPMGGYSATFKGFEHTDAGMTMQINVHEQPGTIRLDEKYEPHMHAMDNACVISDTTFVSGNRRYTIVATKALPGKAPGRRKAVRTYNYHLSYYIVADGRLLEMHYNYWAKRGNKVCNWQEVANNIATSINWQSNDWAVIEK